MRAKGMLVLMIAALMAVQCMTVAAGAVEEADFKLGTVKDEILAVDSEKISGVAMVAAGDYTYSVNEDGITATITGYTGSGGKITIPEMIDGYTVTTIDNFSFEYNDTITEVVFPDSIVNIKSGVFAGNTSLTKVTFSSNLISIGPYAFDGCSNLTDITLPDKLEVIDCGAFYGCTALKEIVIPASVNCLAGAFAESGIENFYVDAENQNYQAIDGIVFSNTNTEICVYPNGRKDTAYAIPSFVTDIGCYAFDGVSALQYISIPEGVTTISSYAFCDCDALTEITFPSTLASIGDSSFSYCVSIEEYMIPESVMYIGEYAFENTGSRIDVDEKNAYFKDIDGVLFTKNGDTLIKFPAMRSDKHYDIPDGVNKISERAFYSSSLESIIIPGSINQIGSYAFASNNSLQEIRIRGTVETLPFRCFDSCTALKNVWLPASITAIEAWCFEGCENLEAVYFRGDVPEIWKAGIFNNTSDALILYYPDNNESGWTAPVWSAPDGLTYNTKAFSFEPILSIDFADGNNGMEFVNADLVEDSNRGQVLKLNGQGIGTSQTSYALLDTPIFGDNIWTNGMTLAMWIKTDAEAVDLAGTVPICSIDIAEKGYFSAICSLENAINSTGNDSNYGITPCVYVDPADAANGVNQTEKGIWQHLAMIYSPDGIYLYLDGELVDNPSVPDDWTMNDCLFQLEFAHGLRLGSWLCEWCNYGDYQGMIDDVLLYNYALDQSEIREMVGRQNPDWQFTVNEDGITASIVDYYGSDTDITIPDVIGKYRITSVGSHVFFNNSDIISVTVPETIQSMGAFAFAGCSNLERVVLPAGLTRLEEDTFSRCYSLQTVNIPENLTYIGKGVFYSCYNLPNVTLPDTLTVIGEGAFSSCSITEFVMPDSVTDLGNSVFRWSENLVSVKLSSGITEISQEMFNGCSGLETITIHAGITSIGSMAFNSCNSLKNIVFLGDVPANWGDHAINSCAPGFWIDYPDGNTSGWTSPTWRAPDGLIYRTEPTDDWTKGIEYVVLEEIAPDDLGEMYGSNYPGSLDWDWPEVTAGDLLKGTVIAGWNGQDHCWGNGNNAAKAFDGDASTCFDPFAASMQSWCGMILEQPYRLTEIRLFPRESNLDRMVGGAVQGSNDGLTWDNIVYITGVNEAPAGYDYHCFTPETNEYYTAYYTDYGIETPDFSIYWVGDGAYRYYRYVNLEGNHGDIAEIELYGVAEESEDSEDTFIKDVDYAVIEEVAPDDLGDMYGDEYPNSLNWDWPEVTTGELLKGTVIAAWNGQKHCSGTGYNAARAFDGATSTRFDPFETSTDSWCGMILEQPYRLTEIRLFPRESKLTNLAGGAVQGSNDGLTWDNIIYITGVNEAPAGYDYHCFTPETNEEYSALYSDYGIENPDFSIYWVGDGAYRYYRYVNLEGNHGEIVEIELYGVAENPDAPEVMYSVSGSVTSYGDFSEPVTIRVLGEGENVVLETSITGSTYTIELPAGSYILEVSKKNHVTRRYSFALGQ